MIRPAPEWNRTDWAAQSAAVHRISVDALQDAPTASIVVDGFLENLAGRVPVSDAPEFEKYWLSRLFEAGGRGDAPAVGDYHGVSFACFSGLALDTLYETLMRRAVPHRAGPDSARLAAAWRKATLY